MIHLVKFNEFVDNSSDIIESKMQEMKDLVDGISNGSDIIYEWENKNEHELVVNFTKDDVSLKYEFDMNHLHLTKTKNGELVMDKDIDSIEHGLDILEKDIQKILDINESRK